MYMLRIWLIPGKLTTSQSFNGFKAMYMNLFDIDYFRLIWVSFFCKALYMGLENVAQPTFLDLFIAYVLCL